MRIRKREWRTGRQAFWHGLFILTFLPSFSLMSNLPPLTPTDCTIALGITFTPSVEKNETSDCWNSQAWDLPSSQIDSLQMQAALRSHKNLHIQSVIFSTSGNEVSQILDACDPVWLSNSETFPQPDVRNYIKGVPQKANFAFSYSQKRGVMDSLYLAWLFPWSSCWGIQEGSSPYFLSQGRAESLLCLRFELGRRKRTSYGSMRQSQEGRREIKAGESVSPDWTPQSKAAKQATAPARGALGQEGLGGWVYSKAKTASVRSAVPGLSYQLWI